MGQELDELFRVEHLGLVRLAYLLCGSRETAEDVVQVAFGQVAARWGEIDNPGGYLRQVVVNQVKDGQRRTARRPTRGLSVDVEPVTFIPEIDETWNVIQTLPWNQQAVVVLRFYDDLPLVEIADVLGRPPSTVRSDLRRALNRLRKVMP